MCTTLHPAQEWCALSPVAAVKVALRTLGRGHRALRPEIAELDALIAPLVAQINPALLALNGVGSDSAGQLLVTAGQNTERLRSDGAFARDRDRLRCRVSEWPDRGHQGQGAQQDRAPLRAAAGGGAGRGNAQGYTLKSRWSRGSARRRALVTIYGSRCVRVEPDAGRGLRTQGDVPAAAQEAGRLHPRAGRRSPSSSKCCGAGPPPETRETSGRETRGTPMQLRLHTDCPVK